MMMTRRKFVGALSAGTLGLAASAHARDVAAAPVARGGGFAQAANAGRSGTDRYRIGLETYSFHDVDMDTMLKHVGSLGLEYLELHEGHLPVGAPPDRIARTQK